MNGLFVIMFTGVLFLLWPKEEYQYDYQGRVLQSLTGRTYMESLGDYTQKTEYDYAGNAIKTYRADGSYMTASYDNFGNISAVRRTIWATQPRTNTMDWDVLFVQIIRLRTA